MRRGNSLPRATGTPGDLIVNDPEGPWTSRAQRTARGGGRRSVVRTGGFARRLPPFSGDQYLESGAWIGVPRNRDRGRLYSRICSLESGISLPLVLSLMSRGKGTRV
jgi:hypothetical protein